MASAAFTHGPEDAQPKFALNQPFGDYLIIADAQGTVFCDIVDIVLNRGEEKAEVVILPSACGGKMYSFFFQPYNKVTESGGQLLGSVF